VRGKPESDVIEGEIVDDTSSATGDGAMLPAVQHPTGFDPGTTALALLSDDEFSSRLAMLKKGRERIAIIQRELLIEAVDAEKGGDYGKIPGTDRNTLFKSGAEKLCQFYGLVARIEVTFRAGDNVTTPPLIYDASTSLHLGTLDGPIVATGFGTANAWEKRYLRGGSKACPGCGAAALISSKYKKNTWHCFAKKGGCGKDWPFDHPDIQSQTDTKGVITDAYDLGVTLAKMAEKRSHVDATLRATATSGLFTQDVVEDENDDTALGPNTTVKDSGETVTSGGAMVDADGVVTGRQDTDYDGSPLSAAAGVTAEEASDEAGKADADTGLTPPEEEAVEALDVSTTAADAERAAKVNELAAAGTAVDPKTGKIDADAIVEDPDPEFTPSDVKDVGRGGSTKGSNGVQIEEVKRRSKEMGLGPYGLIDFMMERGVLDPKIGKAMKDIEDKAAAARAIMNRLEHLSGNDIGKLIHDMREAADGAST
jgi:hypothetical protein